MKKSTKTTDDKQSSDHVDKTTATKSDKRKCDNLLEYLDANDPDLIEWISMLALNYLFNPKDKVGITFLWPQDKDFRALIADHAYGDDNDQQVASKMISSCIIYDNLRSAPEFKEKADDIPNALHQAITIDVSGTSTDVRFDTGARAVLDRNFNNICNNNKLNVYKLYGSLRQDYPPATMKYIQSKQKVRRSRASKTAQPLNQSLTEEELNRETRWLVYMDATERYESNKLKELRDIKRNQRKFTHNPFLNYVLEISEFMMNHRDSIVRNRFVRRVLPLISFSIADFFLIFEPYAVEESSVYIVDNTILDEWFKARPDKYIVDAVNVINAIDNLLKDPHRNGTPCASMRDGGAEGFIVGPVDDARDKVLGTTNSRLLPEVIAKIYNDACSSNHLFDESNVFTPDLYELYKSRPYRKLLEDEFRYEMHRMFLRLDKCFTKEDFVKFLDIVEEYVSNNDRTLQSRLKLLNAELIKHHLNLESKVACIRQFLNSNAFMFVPIHKELLDDYPYETVLHPGKANQNAYWNIVLHMRCCMDSYAAAMRSSYGAPEGNANKKALAAVAYLKDNYHSFGPELRGAISGISGSASGTGTSIAADPRG